MIYSKIRFLKIEILKNLHLINEASLEALNMNLSSEETTAQVTGSLWPLNTVTSEGSGTIYWTGEIKKSFNYLQNFEKKFQTVDKNYDVAYNRYFLNKIYSL